MGFNLYLPQKQSRQKQYSLPSVGTYSWTAPDAKGDSSDYYINVMLWGAGGSGSRGAYTLSSGASGGAGAWVNCEVKVTPGATYQFRVGSGGAAVGSSTALSTTGASGNAGQSSYVLSVGNSTQIVNASGGNGAVAQTDNQHLGGASVSYSVTQPSLVQNLVYIAGTAGSNGYWSNTKYNGTNVSPQYSQPGGTGGIAGTGSISGQGSGSPASASCNGSNGGTNYLKSGGLQSGTGGGAGAPGYYPGDNGQDSTLSDGTTFAGGSGKGGDGYITFNFIVLGEGSEGSAPA